uniref:Uncharacterized protein n=1 Tax=Brassica oleracea TaxID=3712 RepID=A0A3P6F0Y5_BRAOL|nr:unnamed protein product [Brassica oleracea]
MFSWIFRYISSSTRSNKGTQLLFSPDPASLERSIRKEAHIDSVVTDFDSNTHRSTTTLVRHSIFVNHRRPRHYCRRPTLAHHRRPKTLTFCRPISYIRHRSILQFEHRSILSCETWLRH